MRYKPYFALAFLVLGISCKDFKDAGLTERKTFIHFYSSAANYVGSVAELDRDGGFILSGEVRYDNGMTNALIIKTDARGHKMWETVIPRARVNAIEPTADGYILAGDSIQLNPGSDQVNELENSYAKLMLMDAQGNILGRHITTDTVMRDVSNQAVTLTVDYHADALTLDQNGNIIMLGSFEEPGQNAAGFVSAFSASDIQDSLWHRTFRSLENDVVNSHALHLSPTFDIVWASNTFTQNQNVTREYMGVYRLEPNSAFEKYEKYGKDEDRNHAAMDIRESAVGYGVVGTYAETNGLNANIFFLRLDANLNVVNGSVRYIDGETLLLSDSIFHAGSKNISLSYDEGLALASTADGFVLATAMTSTPAIGNGGKDILLIKLDPFGNLLWKKLLGGTGDEVISSIRETPDKGLLLYGTNTINGLSSLMLIKTDEQGEIKD